MTVFPILVSTVIACAFSHQAKQPQWLDAATKAMEFVTLTADENSILLMLDCMNHGKSRTGNLC